MGMYIGMLKKQPIDTQLTFMLESKIEKYVF